jgi:formate C-acetyltransferase
MVHDYFAAQKNYRGGTHATGWWSMANHAVYGRVTGALPSGRLAGEPFTPGLTPHPSASHNLLDNLRDVAKLKPETLDNSIAFNVKVVPSSSDSHEKIVGSWPIMPTLFQDGRHANPVQCQFIRYAEGCNGQSEHYRTDDGQNIRLRGVFHETAKGICSLEVIRRAEYKI